MERSLRSLIRQNAFVSNDNLRVTAEPITDAKFAERGGRLSDPACQLAVHYTHAVHDSAGQSQRAGTKRQRKGQTENDHATAAPAAAAVPSPPVAAPLQPPADAAASPP